MKQKLKKSTKYDVIIIGAGPAGLAVAHYLANFTPNIRVILLEAGRYLYRRSCPVDAEQSCKGCGGVCNVISGFGGCMHYGDGIKLSLMPSGRRLMQLLGEEVAYDLAHQAFELLATYTHDRPVFKGQNISSEIHQCFKESDLSIREYPVAVVSETQLKQTLEGLYEYLSKKVTLQLETTVTDIWKDSSEYTVVTKSKNGFHQFSGYNVIFATGRRGLVETQTILKKMGVSMLPPTASIGVRFEMCSSYLRAAGLVHPDMKISRRTSSAEKVKTFCFCGGVNGGRIKFTNYQNAFGKSIITLDGHETCEREPIAGKDLAANFGLLYQVKESEKNFEKWFKQSVLTPYLQISNGRPLVQRLRTFQNRESETLNWNELRENLPFKPSVSDLVTGSLYELFDEHNHTSIVESFNRVMIPILKLAGEKKSVSDLLDEVLVLGLEIEFLWNQVGIDSYGETFHKGLFVIGDAAGIAQGIIQAMMMGLQVGRRIADNLSL